MLVDLLIVEDDPTTRMALDAIFRADGWTTRLAPTLADARAMMAHDRPRAIILDLRLPDGDGLDVLRQIKAAGWPTRIVVATGADRARGDEARALGADLVLAKPVDMVALLASVRGGLEGRD